MSGECEKCWEHTLDCICKNKKSYTCFSCGFFHKKVEAKGIFYCPNALCCGSGGAWFRDTLDSYKENNDNTHCVDENEWLKKGKEYNEENNIPISRFIRSPENVFEWIYKNPYECEDINQLREIAFYWMQKANRFRAEKDIFSDMLIENEINPTLEEIISRLNKSFDDKSDKFYEPLKPCCEGTENLKNNEHRRHDIQEQVDPKISET